jgi:hypothetical protein
MPEGREKKSKLACPVGTAAGRPQGSSPSSHRSASSREKAR